MAMLVRPPRAKVHARTNTWNRILIRLIAIAVECFVPRTHFDFCSGVVVLCLIREGLDRRNRIGGGRELHELSQLGIETREVIGQLKGQSSDYLLVSEECHD